MDDRIETTGMLARTLARQQYLNGYHPSQNDTKKSILPILKTILYIL